MDERAIEREYCIAGLIAALKELMEEYRCEFDDHDGRWNANGEPAMVNARAAIDRAEGRPAPAPQPDPEPLRLT